jgi:hypothetical protein
MSNSDTSIVDTLFSMAERQHYTSQSNRDWVNEYTGLDSNTFPASDDITIRTLLRGFARTDQHRNLRTHKDLKCLEDLVLYSRQQAFSRLDIPRNMLLPSPEQWKDAETRWHTVKSQHQNDQAPLTVDDYHRQILQVTIPDIPEQYVFFGPFYQEY